MTASRRIFRDLGTVALIAALLSAVYLLPPDTSLSEVRRRGALDVCVPTAFPPLVTGDAQRPGFEVELLRAAARQMNLGLTISVVPAIGRSFNPRDWHITRARCHVIAGGVVDTPVTRSFLDLTKAHTETGWAMLLPPGDVPPDEEALTGAAVGVVAGVSGMDRLALSRVLRAADARTTIFPTAAALEEALSEGRITFGIAEAQLLEPIAAGRGWSLRPVPGLPTQHAVAFGLWKGDLTLKRALNGALEHLDRDGTAEALRKKYFEQSVPG